MKVVKTLHEIPSHISYMLWGCGEDEKFLKRLIDLACPTVQFKGYVARPEEISILEEGYVIICNPAWPEVVLELLKMKIANVMVIPLPKGEPWTYWEFFQKTIQYFQRKEERVYIAQTDWENHLIHLQMTQEITGWKKFLLEQGIRLNKRKTARGVVKFIPVVKEVDPFEKKSRIWGNYPQENIINEYGEQIDYVRRRLSDQLSQDAFMKIFLGKPYLLWENYLNGLFKSLQYFEYLPVEKGDVIINGGVHEGWEIPFFVAQLQGEGSIHNIDPIGYNCLSEYVSVTLKYFQHLSYEHRIALHHSDGKMTSSIDAHGQAVGISEDEYLFSHQKRVEVPCMRLETFIKEKNLPKVDVIKLDLEGWEEYVVPTLPGIIQQYRPKLAISIYHKLEHLWEIPIHLMQMCREYNFYLNIYSWDRYEIVLYCIPWERDRNGVSNCVIMDNNKINKGF